MGEVYRALDPRLGREVAIKVLPESVATDPNRLRRFEQETRAVGALNHPHILTVHDVGTHDGTPYVVTELLEGETLREVLLRRRPTTRQVVAWGMQAAQGLSAAHRKGIVHRDVKPENLFLTSDGRIKILDFGLAKLTQVDGRPSDASVHGDGGHGARGGAGHGGLHVARAGDGRGGGSPLGHLLSGRGAVRASLRGEPVPAGQRTGDA